VWSLIRFRRMAKNERRCFNRLQTSFIGSLTRSWSWSSNHGSSKVRHDLVPLLERVPIKWNHLIDKDAAQIQRVGACPDRKSRATFSGHALVGVIISR
jgi:hypothetical protein